MPLETAAYIHELNPANPTSADPVGQGDDHLRQLKQVLRNQFPNLTGPVTATQNQLNVSIPVGIIAMWHGTIATIPAGWAMCDGQTVPRSDGAGNITLPDLRNRFILGSVSPGDNPPGTTGGAFSGVTAAAGAFTSTVGTTYAGDHDHGGTVSGTAITQAQMPSHYHDTAALTGSGQLIRTNASGMGDNSYTLQSSGDPGQGGVIVSGTKGGDQTHTHSVPLHGGHTHSLSVGAGDHTHGVTTIPPYWSLCYIGKV